MILAGFPWVDKWPVLTGLSSTMCAFLLVTVIVQGCNTKPEVDQCARERAFSDCLESAPNKSEFQERHWADVVRECEQASYAMSVRRHSKYIKERCRR